MKNDLQFIDKVIFENLLTINPDHDIDDIELSSESLIGLFKDKNISTNKLLLRFIGENETFKDMFVTINDDLPTGTALYDCGNYGENTTEIILPI